MGKKTTFAFALGAGFLLGSKAGPKYYEGFKRGLTRLRHTRLVSSGLEKVADRAADAVRIQGVAVTEKLAEDVHRKIVGPTIAVETYIVEEPGEQFGQVDGN